MEWFKKVTRLLNKSDDVAEGEVMFGIGDKVKWGTDQGSVVDSNNETFTVKFTSGATFGFLQATAKFDDGKSGVGEAVILVSKAGKKGTVKLYRYEKIGKTSTGRTFIKQTEGLYDDEHAAKVLIPEGYTKILESERTVTL